jgi:hypothetical protein
MANTAFVPHEILDLLNEQAEHVKTAISDIKNQGEKVSIGAVFEVQYKMNKLAQLNEFATQLYSALHQAVISTARNFK